MLNGGRTSTNSVRIPYGVPIPRLSAPRTNQKLRVAYFGRLSEKQKRISEVTRAFCEMTKTIPGTEGILYGDGPDRVNVEQILATEGKGLSVRLAGRIPSNEVQSHLSECDVVVLLSDYEGLPIAILEAMACGVVPVCLTMRSGIQELVEHNVTGLVVQNRGDDFLSAIRMLQEDPSLLLRLSRSARGRATNDFSMDHCAQEWSDLLYLLAQDCRQSKVSLPLRMRLPKVNDALRAEDPRAEHLPGWRRAYRRSRMLVGRVRGTLRRDSSAKVIE